MNPEVGNLRVKMKKDGFSNSGEHYKNVRFLNVGTKGKQNKKVKIKYTTSDYYTNYYQDTKQRKQALILP